LAGAGEPADVEDTTVALIQFEGGCTMVLRDMASANLPEGWSLRLAGVKGGASLQPLRFYGETPAGLPTDTTPHVPPNPQGAHVLAYRHFLSCVREGRETLSPGERSVVLMRIIDAVYASAAEGGRQIILEEV
jgi:predicted dehydrogenase